MAGLDRSAESRKRVYAAIERAYGKLGHDCLRLGQFIVNVNCVANRPGPSLFYAENDELAKMINDHIDWLLKQRQK